MEIQIPQASAAVLDTPLQARSRRGSRLAGYALVALGTAVLAGWALDNSVLRSIVPAAVSMKLSSALLFVVYGAALARRGPGPSRLDALLGGVVALVGGLTLLEHLSAVDLRIDQLFVQDPAISLHPGRMPPAAAACFVALGLALPLSDTRWRSLSDLAFIGVGTIALFGATGYLYNVDALFRIEAFSSLASTTAAGLGVASLAALASRPTSGLAAVLASETIAGTIARRGLPAVVGLPIGIGLLALRALEAGWFETSVLAGLSVVTFVLLIGGTGMRWLLSLERSEAARVAGETELRRHRENLNTTLQCIGDGVITTDTEGRVASMNPVAEALTGWTASDALGRAVAEVFRIVSERDRSGVVSPVEQVIRGGVSVGLANHTLLIARDGTERPIGDSAAPIQDGEAMLGVVLVFRDMTDEARSRALLEAAAERAQLLARLSLEFSEAADSVPGLLELVAARISRVLSDLALVMITDGATGALSTSDFAIGAPDAALVAEFRKLLSLGGVKLGQGISGQVAATGTARLVEVANVEQIAAAAPPHLRDMVVRLAPASVLCVPMRSRGRCLGVVTLSRFAPDRPYTEDDLALASEIADRAAVVLDNAFLLRVVASRAADLAREEARFRGVVETMPDALVVVDGDGRIRMVNVQAERQFGYDRGQLLGESIEILVPAAARGLHRAQRGTRDAPGDARAMAARVVPALRRDGTEFPAEISLGPIVTPSGNWTAAVVRNVTARLVLEAASRRAFELEEDSRAANEASRLKSEFLANMSHELRTPLNAILGFTRLVAGGKAGPVTSTQVEYLGDVEEAGGHLLQLINDLLDISKIEAGKMQLELTPVNLGQLAREALATCEGLALGRVITLRCSVARDLPERPTDRLRLKQVLYNLLSNAIKFTPERGTVDLHVGLDNEGNWQLSVTDTGVGISAANLDRLFTPFLQLDAGLARQFGGTGLGLALTRRLVHALGGRIGVTSEVGRGSTFTVTLPASVGHPGE